MEVSMKRLVILAIVGLGVNCDGHAEVVTVPFSAKVASVHGMPFGIQPEAFETIVSGSFSYDTSTPPTNSSAGSADFVTRIPNGFVLNVGGVAITSWSYNIVARNDPSGYSSDLFGVQADDDGNGNDFRVNGVAAQGAVEFLYSNPDNTLFADNDDVLMLPSQRQLDQVELVILRGGLNDEMGNSVSFSIIPEPCAILLAAQALGVLLPGQKRSCKRVQNALAAFYR
jgi:hypothetical protein